ncbi:hypothetical protein KXQ82_07075 [Mucilaginibacter sp. HMF5004]|uniref:hypothetical protein n=1 Tax=Mucilaginibacter rivuli TaxID=2857527 RepID=UPI001C5FD770|nr:hypothetical protein [Mucilaginibacter rivuli]MBW4889469.1 hypothetical protein [Mucilaginibacter rivuli]
MKGITFCIIIIIIFFFHYNQANAQSSILQEGVFDSRYENDVKALCVFGPVKKITEIDSITESKYNSYKKGVALVINAIFNSKGNYKEKSACRADGSLINRDVFEYNTEGQLLMYKHFTNDAAKPRNICKVNITLNTLRYDYYLTGYLSPYATYMKIYNKQGKVIERRSQFPPKPFDITKNTYDKNGNIIGMLEEGNKTVLKYDENNFLTEMICINEKGEIYIHTFYKNDQWGNKTEEKSSVNEGDFVTSTSTYTYDRYHNWITKTVNYPPYKTVYLRNIEYY